MTDVFSKKKRSEIMSKIRGKNTKIEVSFRKLLWNCGLRYRIHSKVLPGKPDVVFQKSKLVVFIDGCFWHKCPKCFKMPTSNTKYWDKKILYNTSKDIRITKELKKLGWKVLRFWEHEIKNDPYMCIKKIKRNILD